MDEFLSCGSKRMKIAAMARKRNSSRITSPAPARERRRPRRIILEPGDVTVKNLPMNLCYVPLRARK